MTDVRTFRAASMQEALDLVRRELGSDAMILHTRQITHRRLLPWKKPVSEVEITVGMDSTVRTPTAPRRSTRKRATASSSRTTRETPRSVTRAPLTTPVANSSQDVTFERTTTDEQIAGADASLRSFTEQRSLPRPATFPSPAVPMPPEFQNTLSSPQQSAPEVPSDFANQLDAIQKMLIELRRGGIRTEQSEVPPDLFHLYTDLIDADVEDVIAKDLMSRLKQTATPQQLQETHGALSLLTAMVEQEIRCSGPIAAVPGKRKIVALVGATGVGKTTTIAKLAANFRLRDGVKMGLVTVDTYRIAAVEQLRTYAEIIDLPMKVVTSPPEMRRALSELNGLDLILIDTAGRSPRDELQIQELKSLLAEAMVDEVHLVLNMTASAKTLEATAEKFAAAGTTSLIMTKLDEAAGMGTLMSVARKIPLPISYLTTGQDVPDDIESANASRIARLILGREKLQP